MERSGAERAEGRLHGGHAADESPSGLFVGLKSGSHSIHALRRLLCERHLFIGLKGDLCSGHALTGANSS
ncbi:MAG: hypothetical protein C4334_02330 [Pyrinomonas sp.]